MRIESLIDARKLEGIPIVSTGNPGSSDEVDSYYSYWEEIKGIPLLTPEQERTFAKSLRRGQLAFELIKSKLASDTSADEFVGNNSCHTVFAYSPIAENGLRIQKIAQALNFSPSTQDLISDASSAMEAHNALVLHNLQWAAHLARMNRRISDIHDKIQSANLGLMVSIAKFDYRKGTRLNTYTTPYINKFINEGSSRSLPCILAYKKQNPNLKDVRQVDPMDFEDSIPDNDNEADTAESALRYILASRIRALVEETTLTGKERDALSLKFGLKDGRTMIGRTTGKIMGITETRVNQLIRNALAKLKLEAELYREELVG